MNDIKKLNIDIYKHQKLKDKLDLMHAKNYKNDQFA